MEIYERIKALRKQQGMSQYELAVKVGYEGRSAISKVENGERDIGQSMIPKYAAALGVTPAFLLLGDVDATSHDTEAGDIAKIYAALSPEKKKQALDFLRYLSTTDK